jgi:hypothetical protein
MLRVPVPPWGGNRLGLGLSLPAAGTRMPWWCNGNTSDFQSDVARSSRVQGSSLMLK